ncbi:uncharacterized protein CTHT_0049940 [Thermochaetoides thermophila DSM 1495]|uniref:Golgi apparatus membrane protein TVP38 n=1 Tax=Chaetomium thermophilum (strain DSM 1495 / CBS 144.50 / IMI 039719) TaxID=759272 RepID=G0SBE1_CHATD|nr:hypothetical protein CTHT_0049940 [Thermochaetoides thermophila DSM 1495]EGS19521.1 hypothetical protein CTHT_0049940 [Thermochaetoides thermophila DSM 1495]
MKDNSEVRVTTRRLSRTLSVRSTNYQPVNWRRLFFAPKYLVWWIIGIIVFVISIFLTVYHHKVVHYLRPWSEKVRDLPAGWVIPIVILIIISFPPLFGHELVALLCGLVYGLWIGFGIVAAGTFLGELGTWFAFTYLFRRRAIKLERTNLNYGALARLTRDGGFWIIFIIRLSAIPSHFSTAVFSTCGVRFWSFALATFLTLPKQIFLVYLGTLLVETDPSGNQNKKEDPTTTIIKDVVFGVVFVVTVVMAGYIYVHMRRVKKVLLAEQEERRIRKEEEALARAAAGSEVVLPLTVNGDDVEVDIEAARSSMSSTRTPQQGSGDPGGLLVQLGGGGSGPNARDGSLSAVVASIRRESGYDPIEQEENRLAVGGNAVPASLAPSRADPLTSPFLWRLYDIQEEVGRDSR